MSILSTIICLLLSSALSSRLLVPEGPQPEHGWPAVLLLHDHGARFEKGWQKVIGDDPEPYYSFGNGSAMRVSPVGFIAKDVEEARELSRKVTEITHNHPEGIKGAEATAVAIVMARQGKSKEEIREVMEREYYPSVHTVDEYREIIRGHGDETCQVSLPEALQCFYEGESYEDVIRNCISIGGTAIHWRP